MSDIIKIQDQYYILAHTSLADSQVHILKYGHIFAVFDRHGNIRPLGFENHGIFYQDTRYLSRLHLKLDGHSPLLLSSSVKEENDFLIVDLTNPDFKSSEGALIPKGTIHLEKTICLLDGRYFERMQISNFGTTPVQLTLQYEYDSDYADIFEVRGLKRERRGEYFPPEYNGQHATFGYRGLDGIERRTRIDFRPAPTHVEGNFAKTQFALNVHETRSFELTITCLADQETLPSISFDEAFYITRQHYEDHYALSCSIDTNNDQFNEWLTQSRSDLHMLLTKTPQGLYPFAGIPWFSTIFGRDGIITALETLWFYPDIARGVLNYLADTQATEVIESQEAEPGKILHEVRQGEMARTREIPFGKYYGSVDATPLFIILAGAYWERTHDLPFLKHLWPHVQAALQWIDRYGDIDNDGFIEYRSRSSNGLTNQGWKDSEDSVFHEDGTFAEAPIALCEVQGYVYEAKLRASAMAEALDQTQKARDLKDTAESFRAKFEKAFWCEDIGMYAIALDKNKRPCKVRSSNSGQCLFTGIASQAHAERIADNLKDSRFFTGWGVRTIARGEARYNPMSYHNGSIWPHDNAMIAYGLGRYGYKEEAIQILSGLFEGSLFLNLHRLPELFCGFDRRQGDGPTLYPVACDPQAWAAGAVFLLLQTCLGLKIDALGKKIIFDHPALPSFLSSIWIKNLKVGKDTVEIRIDRQGDKCRVDTNSTGDLTFQIIP